MKHVLLAPDPAIVTCTEQVPGCNQKLQYWRLREGGRMMTEWLIKQITTEVISLAPITFLKHRCLTASIFGSSSSSRR